MSKSKRFVLETFVNEEAYNDFVELVTSGEVFNNPYGIGYWAYGVREWKHGGWILFDTQNEHVADKEYAVPTPKELDKLERVLEVGLSVPQPFYILDLVSIENAFKKLLEFKGVRDIEAGGVDLSDADWAIQEVLFGKQVYG